MVFTQSGEKREIVLADWGLTSSLGACDSVIYLFKRALERNCCSRVVLSSPGIFLGRAT